MRSFLVQDAKMRKAVDVCACIPDRDGPVLRLHIQPPKSRNSATEGEDIKEGRTYRKGFVPNPKEKEVDAKKTIIKYELYSTIG